MLVLATAVAIAAAQAQQVQTAPIDKPRGEEESSARPAVKGRAAISQEVTTCATVFHVKAEALFAPHRWTLNPDAGETLDVLGPMILKVGKHAAEVMAETSTSDSDGERREVSHRRAVTVRTWLVNHHIVPEDTAIRQFDLETPPPGKAAVAPEPERPREVMVFILTCR